MGRARAVFKAVGHTLYLARVYHVISWVHLDEHKIPDALDAAEEAWKYAELTVDRFIQSSISLTFGIILFKTNQDTKAWKHIEIALTNASYIGDRYEAAVALEYMGYGYLRRGDYKNAYGAYEAAAEKFFGVLYKGDAERCKKSMALIESKQANPDTVVGFPRPGMDIDRTLLYPPIQAQVLASELPISHS